MNGDENMTLSEIIAKTELNSTEVRFIEKLLISRIKFLSDGIENQYVSPKAHEHMRLEKLLSEKILTKFNMEV